jgi:CemA family
MTLVSDSISAMVFFAMFVRDVDARSALFSTIGRLFEGLSDIAKAVLIILVADTLLGYHSEEGEDCAHALTQHTVHC